MYSSQHLLQTSFYDNLRFWLSYTLSLAGSRTQDLNAASSRAAPADGLLSSSFLPLP